MSRTAPPSNRRVALVAPEFPPSNTAGAHRPRLFAKHLPSLGWVPTVITLRPECFEGPLDPTLDCLVDAKLRVIRTRALPVRPIRLVGDLGLRSLPAHARVLSRLCRRREVEAIVLFGPPWFSFVLGPVMRRRHGVPYVVDYIDPWFSDWTAAQPFPRKAWFYHRLAELIEPSVLRYASRVTAVSGGILCDLCRRYPWLQRARLSAMPYGAEPEDIEAAGRLGVPSPDFNGDEGLINLCFTGALQRRGREILRALFGAVALVRERDAGLGSRIRLRFYGTSNLPWGHGQYRVLPVAREMGLDGIVSEIPERIPYLQAMAVLRRCDVVLVMGSWDHYYHASKLYPAILCGRPVLALCHQDSSIRRVMAETGVGECVTFTGPDDVGRRVDEIVGAMTRLLRGDRQQHAVPAAAVRRFSARSSAEVLAAALDAAVRPGPGSASASEARARVTT